jgi:hypothetical protein
MFRPGASTLEPQVSSIIDKGLSFKLQASFFAVHASGFAVHASKDRFAERLYFILFYFIFIFCFKRPEMKRETVLFLTAHKDNVHSSTSTGCVPILRGG